MPEPSGATAIAVLAAVLLFLIWKLRQALKLPLEDTMQLTADGTDSDYQALAQKDGIDPSVADAFEIEMKLRGEEIRRKDAERRKREAGDDSAGFDIDPF